MKYFVCVFLCLTTTSLFSQSIALPPANRPASVAPPIAAQSDPKAQATILDSYGKLPLSFEANYGQTDPQAKFLSRTRAYSIFLTGDEAVFVLSPKTNVKTKATTGDHLVPSKTANVLRMKLRNANPAAKVVGSDELAGKSNYFIGNDPKKWRTGVPTYAKVKYEGIYSGIDLVYYGNQRQLEYDFIVAPGADPHRIAFTVTGAKRFAQDANGDLAITMKATNEEIRWHKPMAYQETNGVRQEVASTYTIKNNNEVAFELAKYDTRKTLYIDPLIYSTYLGGSSDDIALGITVDSSGNAYLTGWTSSNDFPTMNPLQTTNAGDEDAFVVKLNSAGSALVYSTYLGGSGQDNGVGIAVDASGNCYVTGVTSSPNFPTMNPLQATYGGGNYDAFVSKLNPTGTALVYSTYLGASGDDVGYGIGVDATDDAYITGYTTSTNFPTMNPLQSANGGAYDAFVAQFNPSGSALVYSTYLGGSEDDIGLGLAVDSSGNAYITGVTGSTNFPTKNPLQPANGGAGTNSSNAFVTKINHSGSLVYSTYLGGSGGDDGFGIAVDSAGNAYVTGYTDSTNFPTANPLQATPGGNGDAFVSKINSSGTALSYSTYLGGGNLDWGYGIAVDNTGNAYVTGYTASTNFPTSNPFQAANAGGYDIFVTQINPSGSGLVYSTYLGGSGNDYGRSIAVDATGSAYISGYTASTNFPTASPLQPEFAGGDNDAFITKLSGASTSYGVVSPTSVNFDQVLVGQTSPAQRVSLTNTGTSELTVSDIEISGEFALPTNHCANGVKPGTHCDVYVTFTPKETGTETGTLTFIDNASNSPQTVSLTGVGSNTAPTATTITASPKSINAGQTITFTATVTSLGGGVIPDGEQVTFYTSYGWLGTGTLQSGVAILTTTSVRGIGQDAETITAEYVGDQNFDSSKGNVDISVYKWPVTITAAGSPNPAMLGEPITLTAKISSSSPVAPTGNIYFYKVRGWGVIQNGVASVPYKPLPQNCCGYGITATYKGDDYNLKGEGKGSGVLNPSTTTTTIKSSKNPSTQGQAVTFTVAVKAPYLPLVDGSVTFTSGSTTLGTVQLSDSRGSITTPSLPVGQDTITATYTPSNANFLSSTGSLVQTVQ